MLICSRAFKIKLASFIVLVKNNCIYNKGNNKTYNRKYSHNAKNYPDFTFCHA